MNDTERHLLDLIKQLPPLQILGPTKDHHAIQVSPLYARDLSPKRMDGLLVKLREFLQEAESLARSTTNSE